MDILVAYAGGLVLVAFGAIGYVLGWKAGRERGFRDGYTLASRVNLKRSVH